VFVYKFAVNSLLGIASFVLALSLRDFLRSSLCQLYSSDPTNTGLRFLN
jgi:hypothetical protein